jgi:NAD(P)-dependent dehydrogenase (short-subunit alcohol dehydrogenase family)
MINISLQDKVALITGASRGIGEAVALALAECGAHCILVSRKLESLNTVAGKIREKGGNATAIACNMSQMDQIEKLFAEVGTKFGKLDILINNAAANPYFGEMLGNEEWAWDKTFAVNLKGPFFMIQKAVPLMMAAGSGTIVNVSSVNGVRPAAFQGVYSITKAGLISMTQAYAKELASKKIRVNALLPGFTRTDFSRAIMDNEDIFKFVVQQIPMGREANPSEMVGAVLYLVSDLSSYTTGTCIVCDGGMLA